MTRHRNIPFCLRWIKHELRAWCGLNPSVFALYSRFFDDPILRRFYSNVQKQALVVEGFGGSANSFVWWTIRLPNPESPIGHHIHVPAHVVRALYLQIPVILLVRDPVGSVTSLYSRGYIPSLKQGFRHYSMFHEKLLPVRDRMLIADFKQVTSDMGQVIERCNQKFGTAFVPFEHTDENVRDCRERVPSSRRTDSRDKSKEQIMTQIQNDSRLQKAVQQAEYLYEQFAPFCGTAGR